MQKIIIVILLILLLFSFGWGAGLNLSNNYLTGKVAVQEEYIELLELDYSIKEIRNLRQMVGYNY